MDQCRQWHGALAFMLLFSGCYLASFPPSDSKPPVSPSPSSPTPEAPTDPPAPSHAPTLPPLPPDVIPELPGSQTKSLNARPSFAYNGYAPQIPSAYQLETSARYITSLRQYTPPHACGLFDEAKAQASSFNALEGEMLVCAAGSRLFETKFAFNLSGQATTRADLRIYAGFDPKTLRNYGPEVIRADGPDDTGYACITLPVVHLSKGKALHFAIDNLGTLGSVDYEIGKFALVFSGELPMRIQRDSTGITCRLVPRSKVEMHVTRALLELDELIAAMDTSLVVRMDQPTDFGRLKLHSAKVFIEQVAAWVGWEDPRLKKRLDRVGMLEQRFEQELRDALLALSDSLPPPPEWISPVQGSLSFRAPVFYCGDREKKAIYSKALKLKDAWPRYESTWRDLDCLVHIGIRNDSASSHKVPVYAEGIDRFDIRFIDRRGFNWPLNWVGTARSDGLMPREIRNEDNMLSPGESIELLFDIQTNYPMGRTQFIPDSQKLLPNPSDSEPFLLYVAERSHSPGRSQSRYLRIPALPGPH